MDGEVTHETERLRFVEVVWPGKTRKWEVQTATGPQRGKVAGHIGWWGPWQQYAFHPVDKSLWDVKSLRDIVAFIAHRQVEQP